MLKLDIPSFTNIPAVTDELEATARKLKAELIKRGVGTYEGSKFFAEVQHYDRATISSVLVRKLSNDAFIEQVTEVKPVDAVVVKPLEK